MVPYKMEIIRGDNLADTGTRGILAECLEESSWVRGPSFLVGYEYLSNHIWMLLSIFFQKSVVNTIDNSPHALTSISKQSESVFG